jgi:hypothetical protein
MRYTQSQLRDWKAAEAAKLLDNIRATIRLISEASEETPLDGPIGLAELKELGRLGNALRIFCESAAERLDTERRS